MEKRIVVLFFLLFGCVGYLMYANYRLEAKLTRLIVKISEVEDYLSDVSSETDRLQVEVEDNQSEIESQAEAIEDLEY